MKTIRQWLDILPEDIKNKALKYISNEKGLKIKELDYYLNTPHKSMLNALKSSFLFNDTEEGHEYWWNLGENFLE